MLVWAGAFLEVLAFQKQRSQVGDVQSSEHLPLGAPAPMRCGHSSLIVRLDAALVGVATLLAVIGTVVSVVMFRGSRWDANTEGSHKIRLVDDYCVCSIGVRKHLIIYLRESRCAILVFDEDRASTNHAPHTFFSKTAPWHHPSVQNLCGEAI